MARDNDEDRNQRIQQRAYALWEAAGRPEGQDDHFWHMAEHDIEDQDREWAKPKVQPKP